MANVNTVVFKNVNEVAKYLAPLRAQGRSLATTNGCFDIIHTGHVKYLAEAAKMADLLVVGINSDSSVKKLKGSGRPVQTDSDRAHIVASLKMVDCAFIFHEDDPRVFLEILRPDVHIKGGDYSKDIIEREVVEKYGGRVSIVSFIPGRSTSDIIKLVKVADLKKKID